MQPQRESSGGNDTRSDECAEGETEEKLFHFAMSGGSASMPVTKTGFSNAAVPRGVTTNTLSGAGNQMKSSCGTRYSRPSAVRSMNGRNGRASFHSLICASFTKTRVCTPDV